MYFGSGPNCAAILDYIESVDKNYAENIKSICAGDILSDNLGITVIIPDKKFIEVFNKNASDSGNISNARRMLMNTVIKRNLPSGTAFNTEESFKKSLPLRSGVQLAVTSVNGDEVTLGDNITIEPETKFKSPKAFNYAVWRVKSGQYPTDTNFNFKNKSRGRKDKKNRDSSKGGGCGVSAFIDSDEDDNNSDKESALSYSGGGGGKANKKFMFAIQVGRQIKGSPDTMRVSMVGAILKDYRNELMRDRCARRNPLLVKAVSLYNWLSMYYPSILDSVLPITDIHPGVNLMLLILDPNSPVTVDMILGNGDSDAPVHISQGWKGIDVTNNPYTEWKDYLSKASKMLTNIDRARSNLRNFRKNVAESTKLDYSSSASLVTNMYKEFAGTGNVAGINVYPQDTVRTLYTGDMNKDRKLWQDQMRFVGTCAFSGSCDLHVVSAMDIDEELAQAVRFRPIQGYTNACVLTTINTAFEPKDDYYAYLKWLYSTDLMNMVKPLDSDMVKSTTSPYDGLEYGKINKKSILNNDHIKAQMVEAMKGSSKPSAVLTYAQEWSSKNRESSVGGINRDLGTHLTHNSYTNADASHDNSYGDIGSHTSHPGMYGSTYGETDDFMKPMRPPPPPSSKLESMGGTFDNIHIGE